MPEVSTLNPVTSSKMRAATPRANLDRRYACYAALLVSLLFFAALRFHFRNMPLERDEGEYAYMGQLLLHGVPPYKLAYTMKLPGTCIAYAAMMAAFGETPAGIRLGMILVTSLCAILIFLLGKRLYGSLAGSVAGITYVFLAIRPGVLGMDGHATHFVVLFALAGILLLLRSIERGKTILFFASGLSFGLAFLMKQPGIFFGFFGGCYWLWVEWKRGINWKNIAVRGGALTLGAALPYAAVCLWLLRAGVFSNFWFWTWTYARAYGSIMSISDAWRLCLQWTLPWAVRPFVLWEIAAVGSIAPFWSRPARAHSGFVAGFVLTSVLAVVPGLYFRPHYFILLLPAVALCVGIAVECAEQKLRTVRWKRLAFLPVLLFAVAYLLAIRGQWKAYFHLDPLTLSRKMYDKGQSFPEDVVVADFIGARARPGDEIGIIGSEPEVCFYTRLHCATSYLYMYPLMEKQPFARQMQNEMMRQLSEAHPRFLVYVDYERSWGWSFTLEQNRAFLDQTWNFAHQGYDLVNEVAAVDEKTLGPAKPGEIPEPLRAARAAFYIFQRQDQ